MPDKPEELPEMEHVLGAEHFPQCPCFQSERGREERLNMYVMSQEFANGLVSNMVGTGVCLEAMPYFIALFNSMCCSMIASAHVTLTVGRDISPEGNVEFSRVQHEIWQKTRERMDALIRRADRLVFSLSEGTDSVQ